MGYLDAKYLQFIDARGIDVADNRAFQNTPEWTASGTASLSLPIGAGYVDASATAAYRSKTQQFELRNDLQRAVGPASMLPSTQGPERRVSVVTRPPCPSTSAASAAIEPTAVPRVVVSP